MSFRVINICSITFYCDFLVQFSDKRFIIKSYFKCWNKKKYLVNVKAAWGIDNVYVSKMLKETLLGYCSRNASRIFSLKLFSMGE